MHKVQKRQLGNPNARTRVLWGFADYMDVIFVLKYRGLLKHKNHSVYIGINLSRDINFSVTDS